MPAEVERKLAAILSADVVGYSRLMAEDEVEERQVDVHELGIELPNALGLRDPALVLAQEEEVRDAARAKEEVERSDA